MSCSPFDLRDYFLQELADPEERRQVEAHVRVCQPCREELERLRLTEAALFTLRDEEIPQRIAFVSDKVFEPSPLRRWLAAFWGSAARLGFASAAMLSVALIVFATVRPAPAPGPSAAAIEQRVQAAADTAARAIEARYAQKTDQLVKAIEERDQQDRRMMMASYERQSDYQQNKIASLELQNRSLSNSAMMSKDGQ